jgi:hypothetical protein
VAFDRPHTEVELGGDLLVSQSSRHSLCDTPLGVCQIFITYRRLRRGFSFTEEARDLGMHTLYTLEDVGGDGHQFVRLERLRQVGVHSGAKSSDPIDSFVFGCQKNYRDEPGASGGPQIPD